MSASTKTAQNDTPVSLQLKQLLSDSYALMGQSQLAHWNVEGPHFFELHAAFQLHYEELFAAVDEIAERIRSLGVLAPGGLMTLGQASSITEMATETAPAKDYAAHLAGGHEIVLASAAKLRKVAEDAGDLETQDLAIARIQIHQKTLWMLKSFLKNP
jgi:starvation-inducible DNA-binding protein